MHADSFVRQEQAGSMIQDLTTSLSMRWSAADRPPPFPRSAIQPNRGGGPTPLATTVVVTVPGTDPPVQRVMATRASLGSPLTLADVKAALHTSADSAAASAAASAEALPQFVNDDWTLQGSSKDVTTWTKEAAVKHQVAGTPLPLFGERRGSR